MRTSPPSAPKMVKLVRSVTESATVAMSPRSPSPAWMLSVPDETVSARELSGCPMTTVGQMCPAATNRMLARRTMWV